MDLETKITDLVLMHTEGGMKGVELCTKVMVDLFDELRKDDENYKMIEDVPSEIVRVIKEMVESNRLIEVEYILPQDRDAEITRVKAFYLPVGTTVTVHVKT